MSLTFPSEEFLPTSNVSIVRSLSLSGLEVSRTVSHTEPCAAPRFIPIVKYFNSPYLSDVSINANSRPTTIKSNLWITRMKC